MAANELVQLRQRHTVSGLRSVLSSLTLFWIMFTSSKKFITSFYFPMQNSCIAQNIMDIS